MTYGNIIRRLRNERNMTLTQFAKLVGSSKSHIQRLENEASSVGSGMKLTPSLDTLKQICDRTGYPFRQFLEESGYIEPVSLSNKEYIQLFEQLDDTQKSNVIYFIKGILDTQSSTIPTILDENNRKVLKSSK